jgi:hypothetical protein
VLQLAEQKEIPERQLHVLSYWKEDGIRSCWTDLWPEICSIVITPGRIEAYEISAAHSSPIRTEELASSGSSDLNSETDAGADRPLVALDLTPLVTLRQSNAVDIEVKSPTLSQSRLKCRGNVRFRTLTAQDGVFLYRAVHYARMNNAVFIKLEEERRYASFWHPLPITKPSRRTPDAASSADNEAIVLLLAHHNPIL